MNVVYVLVMLFAIPHHQGDMESIQIEFNTFERCEIARAEIAKAHSPGYRHIVSQGCYRK